LPSLGGFIIMFVRTENFRTFMTLYPIVSFIIFVHIVLWGLTYFPFDTGKWLMEQMVGFNYLIKTGEYWRLVTPIFLHGHFSHFLFNSISLIIFGPALERMMGKSRFVIAYLGSGILANLATYFIETLMYSHVGSSGAIFGLFGIYAYLVVFRKERINPINSQMIMTILIIGLIMTFLNSNINITAHLFGFLAGGILAPFLIPKHLIAAQDTNFRKEIDISKPTWSIKSIVWMLFIALVILGILSKI
jgi:rhomboid protease GluP